MAGPAAASAARAELKVTTLAMPSIISREDIFDLPWTRSTKRMGISATLKPALWQRTSSSTRVE